MNPTPRRLATTALFALGAGLAGAQTTPAADDDAKPYTLF
jgi:hypothetical protein